ncbi:hypothetical protein [Streptomyces melanogenes]|uniref:Uncharacterized protein n=1 Tax=Streptomyces melanogenes TaxID=67326 RepID=A0ABZ1XND5_9ACTN|nr:hypothetical protein [Streptomyces melanogenes]
MNPYAVLAAAAAEWDTVGPRLDADVREELAVLLARVRAAARLEADPTGTAERAVELLRTRLPDRFGPGRFAPTTFRPATDDDLDASYLGFRAEDLAVLLLDGHRMVGPVLGAVRERLLAAPAVDGDTVLRAGGDPYAPGLVRLRGEGGVLRLPAFQFSEGTLPWLTVLEVNEVLRADTDPWGAADWWLSENAWLGTEPVRLLGTPDDRRLAATARHLVEGE